MIEHLGLLGALALLILLALRGVNIIFASLLCSLVIVITNQLPLADSFSRFYSFGPLGAFTFAGKFFLLFVSGAIFGRVMGDSHAASSIALSLAKSLGPQRALWITALATALLTYCGVVVFIVIFAIYPLGLKLLQQANIPKRLFCAAMVLGSGTFTLTALPGTPSIQNVIASTALGTDLFAGAGLGLFATLIMFGVGIWYLERERQNAITNGDFFVPAATDRISNLDTDDCDYPDWRLAILPLCMVILTIISPRLLSALVESELTTGSGWFFEVLRFANQQLILWPSIALFTGSLVTVLMFPALRTSPLQSLGAGAEDAIMPLLNTAAVIGFGGIVTHTLGFQQFSSAMLETDLPPLLSMFASVSLSSALVGSSSGGLQIFMATMAPAYLEMGISTESLHRLAAMASGGFDSLPHCGAVIAILTITGLTHREAYKDLCVITVVIPVFATLAAIGLTATIG